ncbi:SUMF1/EgtB/PvdO family nonheme iron enzyme [Rufibacter ruber]|uniref:SUMF1/EgtB/PvdO family nonheme iron enzyme n=1 Tax=Rufibacter ruber TaxID=1783499 RepID=UPI00083082EE|nr:SUMF1/EgtB/PvdO family nonheme iron enzyme [Rufibacter ruber]
MLATQLVYLIFSFLIYSFDQNPVGTIKVNRHYIDKTEVLNIHWSEYIYHRSQGLDSADAQKLYPNGSNHWYSQPANRFEPIVLITYEQALDYCAWRSKVVSERVGKKVTFRLPTPTEWKAIAEELIATDLKQIEEESEKIKKLSSKKSSPYILIAEENPKARVYHFFNNVTEMTLEKGIAMGSNNHELLNNTSTLTNNLIKYNDPHPYLGFKMHCRNRIKQNVRIYNNCCT